MADPVQAQLLCFHSDVHGALHPCAVADTCPESILKAAGATRILCHPDPDPRPSEWTAPSMLYSTPWTQGRDGTRPLESLQPDEWSRQP